MISRALLNAPFFIPKDADLLRNRKVNTKKRQNRHLPELAFLILGTYFTAPFSVILTIQIFYASNNASNSSRVIFSFSRRSAAQRSSTSRCSAMIVFAFS